MNTTALESPGIVSNYNEEEDNLWLERIETEGESLIDTGQVKIEVPSYLEFMVKHSKTLILGINRRKMDFFVSHFLRNILTTLFIEAVLEWNLVEQKTSVGADLTHRKNFQQKYSFKVLHLPYISKPIDIKGLLMYIVSPCKSLIWSKITTLWNFDIKL